MDYPNDLHGTFYIRMIHVLRGTPACLSHDKFQGNYATPGQKSCDLLVEYMLEDQASESMIAY